VSTAADTYLEVVATGEGYRRATSALLVHRTINDGRWSTIAFHSARAAS
jgi:hypothetical protein